MSQEMLDYLLKLPLQATKTQESLFDFTDKITWSDFVKTTDVIDFSRVKDVEKDVFGKPFAFKGNNAIIRPDAILPYTNIHYLINHRNKHDIFYFSRQFKIVTLDYGVINMILRPYQELSLLNFKKYSRNIMNSCRQSGKCFFFNGSINIRNKASGKIENISIGKFYIRIFVFNLIKKVIVHWLFGKVSLEKIKRGLLKNV